MSAASRRRVLATLVLVVQMLQNQFLSLHHDKLCNMLLFLFLLFLDLITSALQCCSPTSSSSSSQP